MKRKKTRLNCSNDMTPKSMLKNAPRIPLWYFLRRNLISIVFLIFGIYSAVSLQRDYAKAPYLMAALFALFSIFLLLGGLSFLSDKSDFFSTPKAERMREWIRFLGRNASQSLAQYIFAFCLPFFMYAQRFGYFLLTLSLTLMLLWNPWWERLVQHWTFRRLMHVWSIMCSLSFIYPFLGAEYLQYFYPGLAIFGSIPLLLVRQLRSRLLHVAAGLILVFTFTLFLPLTSRVPMVAIWIHDGHFEADRTRNKEPARIIGISYEAQKLRQLLFEGHEICCVAPIVAPPSIKEHIRQEWSLDGIILENPKLPTAISGNPYQRPFRSFYCKRNFPQLASGSTLSCRLFIENDLYLGEAALRLR
ncbi:MAG: hypothetical protein HQK54_03750 [Oligoflexales bacterium]|nr:hypothetical protein [Oligoflexales bacterium]